MRSAVNFMLCLCICIGAAPLADRSKSEGVEEAQGRANSQLLGLDIFRFVPLQALHPSDSQAVGTPGPVVCSCEPPDPRGAS